MDKAVFIEQAPYHYALAILDRLYEDFGDHTVPAIMNHYSEFDREENAEWIFMHSEAIAKVAVSWLSKNGLINVVEDYFGPEIISPSKPLTEAKVTLAGLGVRVFANVEKVADRDKWIKDGLKRVFRTYHELELREADFVLAENEWVPIPLDRDEPELRETIARLDTTIETVRSENGYNVTAPTERQFVLDSLRAFSSTLKEAGEVSAAYIKRLGGDPLRLVVKRFGRAAAGVAATAVLAALREWLKNKGYDWLVDYLKQKP